MGNSRVDLYWLPLGWGEGGRCVRTSGRLYETTAALRGHRSRMDLFHSALVVQLDGTVFAIEMTPVWAVADADREVVGEARSDFRCWVAPGCSAAAAELQPLRGGRAPEWSAGLVVANRTVAPLAR